MRVLSTHSIVKKNPCLGIHTGDYGYLMDPIRQAKKLLKSLPTRLNNDKLLDKIATGDKKQILHDNTNLSKQWLSKGQCPVPTTMPNLSIRKMFLSVSWGYSGIIHYELPKPRVTITAGVKLRKFILNNFNGSNPKC